MPESSVTTEFTGKADVIDPHGFPIEMDRPVVFDEGKLEPHTELSSTFHAKELGFPGENYYNVPTIYGGKIYDPEKDFETIKQNVQQQAAQGFRFPNFPDIAQAESAAQARSQYFNQVKAQQLQQAVEQQRQNLLLQMIRGQQNATK